MVLINKLKPQVDTPVWEWCRLAPAISSAVSATCAADNSTYHVTFGRYIYYFQANAVAATGPTGTGLVGFFRYDTISDSYQQLAQPPLGSTAFTGMQFAGGQGYTGFVLGSGPGPNTLQVAGLTGQTLKTFDIRISGGTGFGQNRTITSVSDPTIWDLGTVTATEAVPQRFITDSSKNWAMNQWAGYQVRLVSSSGQSQIRKIIYNNSNTLYWADVTKFAEDPWTYSPLNTILGSAEVIAVAGGANPTIYQIESSIITVDSNWFTMPDATSRFVVKSGGIWFFTQGASAANSVYYLQYYDVVADQWYIRNAVTSTSPIQVIGTDGTIVNTGENATVWDRGTANTSASGISAGITQTNTNLVDMTKGWAINQWAPANGPTYYVRIFSGTGENQYRAITSNTVNTLTVAGWTNITPDATTKYFIESFDMGTLTSVSPNIPVGAITVTASGTSGSTSITTTLNTPNNCNNWTVSGTGITPTTTIVSGQGTRNLVLSGNNASTVSGTLIISPLALSYTANAGTINTYVVTTTGAVPYNANGWYISGTGIGIGAVIVSGQGTTTLTLSVVNTAAISGGTLYIYPVAPTPNVFSTACTGTTNTTLTTTGALTPNNCNGWYVSGTNIAINAIVVSGQGTNSLVLSVANTGPVTGNVIFSPTATVGNYASGGAGGATTVTVANNTPPFCNGWYISGTGIAPGTTIVSGQNTTGLTLSLPNTAQVSGVLTYSATTISTGTINGSVFTAGTTTGTYYSGQILTGYGLLNGLQSTKTIISLVADCYTVTTSSTVNFVAGNPITLGVQIGMLVSIVSGTGTIATAATGPTYVTAVTANTVTLSYAVSVALQGATLQFATAWATQLAGHTSQGNVVTLVGGSTTQGLYPGMYLTVGTGTGAFTVGTYVAYIISSTQFATSLQLSTQLSGNTWIWAQGYQTVLQEQLSGTPGGAGTYRVFPSQMVASTTISGSGTNMVTDSTKSWPTNRWINYAIRIKAGTGMGQIRQILDVTSNGFIAYTSAATASNVGAIITVDSTASIAVNQMLNVIAGTGAFAYGTYVQSITNSTTFVASAPPTTALANAQITFTPNNTLKVYPNWTVTPDNTSVYGIVSDPDKNYLSMAAAGQTPIFIHNIDADIPTTARQLDRGVARGISAQYSDYEPVALTTSATTGVPVIPIVGGTGYIIGTGVSVSGASNNGSGVATITFATTTSSGIFPIGSWITVAGITTSTQYNGTWQVINTGAGTVSFFSTTATGTYGAAGTIAQAASFNLAIGTLASGSWLQFGAGTAINVTGCVPTTYNGSLTVACGAGGTTGATFGGWQSAATVTGTNTSTFNVPNTVGLVAGQIPTVTAGVGSFPANTYIVSFVANTSFTINTTATLSGATVTVVPSVAVTATTPIGNLVALGVLQKTPQNSTVLQGDGTTVTVTTSNTIFPIGSYITVSGAYVTAGSGTVNGIYRVNGGNPGFTVTYLSSAVPSTVSTYPTIGIATQTMLCSTVNNNNLQTGLIISHKGDQGFTSTVNNIAAPITVMTPAVAGFATQYTYPTSAPSAPMALYTQTTTTLCDASKNWTPNQWAGCTVYYNSTSMTNAAAPVQQAVISAYIIANTSNTLIFATALGTAPIVGQSRYVITTTATMLVGNTVGAYDSGLLQGVCSATSIQDLTKAWIMPNPIPSVTVQNITVGQSTMQTTTVALMNGILPGMTVAITLGGVTVPAGTTVGSINTSTNTITLANSVVFGGVGTTATVTFAATASSVGNVVTVTGYPLTNLAPGMKLAMVATTNLSPSMLVTGAFVLNGGTLFTPVTVLSITGTNTFTISATPAVPLLNATINATFWVPGQWIGRRIRITSGSVSTNVVETICSANTYNTMTVGTVTTVLAHGNFGYSILQQPVARAGGTALLHNFGASNPLTTGKYLYQARGGNLAGFDRLNLTNDKWDLLTATPSYEPLTTGAMYAYDGQDRIYFTVQVTQRVYYLDIENNMIHSAGMYPYTPGTAIVGNRMEIFTTVDGLRYLWLNRHSFQECFRQLLWY